MGGSLLLRCSASGYGECTRILSSCAEIKTILDGLLSITFPSHENFDVKRVGTLWCLALSSLCRVGVEEDPPGIEPVRRLVL